MLTDMTNPHTALKISNPKVTTSDRGLPYRVRWRAAGKQFERKFGTETEANFLVGQINVAKATPQQWSMSDGLPTAWSQTADSVVSALQAYVAANSSSWAKGSRVSAEYTLARFALAAAYKSKVEYTKANLDEMRDVLGGAVDSRRSIGMVELTKVHLAARWPAVELGQNGQVLGVNTRKTARRIISGFINWAIEHDLLETNPMPKAKRTRSAKTEDVVDVDSLPTPAEMRAAIATMGSEWRRMATLTMLETGCRTGEMRGLQVNDLINGTINFSKNMPSAGLDMEEATKTGKSRVVSVSDEFFDSLVDYAERAGLSGNDLLFSVDGKKPYHHASLSAPFKKASGGKLYDLRHVHASALLAAGVPVADIADRLGHTVATLLRTYVHAVGKVDHSDKIAAALA